jgi:hypothetical protein
MIKIFRNIKGETITETIIAMSIFAIGITLSSTLVAGSLRNINTSKNRVIAVNIAREGIEAIRNVRDTNWLKFSSRRRLCWNHLPRVEEDITNDFCQEDDPGLIESGDYIVYKSEDQRWMLKKVDKTKKTTTDGQDFYDDTRLYTVDIDPSVDTDGDGNKTNDSDMYNHKLSEEDWGNGFNPLGKEYTSPTNFFRMITIDYLDNAGNLLATDLEPTSDYNRMEVSAKVDWIRAEATHTVELKTHLTDYLGRDNLGS